MSELQEVYYEHYKEFEQGNAFGPGRKTLPYMVVFPTNAAMQEFMRVLEEDGFTCLDPSSFAITHNNALLANLKLKRFFVVEKAARHALRRRFAFYDMKPAFNQKRFIEYRMKLDNPYVGTITVYQL